MSIILKSKLRICVPLIILLTFVPVYKLSHESGKKIEVMKADVIQSSILIAGSGMKEPTFGHVKDNDTSTQSNGTSQQVRDKFRDASSIQVKSTKDHDKLALKAMKELDRDMSNFTKKHLPLLTLFTTLRDTPDRVHIHRNTLKNWAEFQPYIIPVLYTLNTNSDLINLAKKLGWKILSVPKTNSHGTPYLKPMYSMAKKYYKSVFYGYANGDLLFANGLIDTLKSVNACLDSLRQTMIIGRRTNFIVSNHSGLFKPEDVKETSKRGELFLFKAEDYFFIANSVFPWHKVPNVVVGRPAYDNFLVAIAWKNNVSVIDATTTLLALHQTGKDGNKAGHHNSNDTIHNKDVIGKFNYKEGWTTNAQYETNYNRKGEVEVWRRSHTVKSMIN